MSQFTVEIMQLRKRPYEHGLAIGKKFKGNVMLEQLENLVKPEINVTDMKKLYRTFDPILLEEIEGIAEGLELNFSKTAALISGYDVPKTPALGCTTLCSKEFYVRNYDFGPELYDGVFTLYQNDKKDTFAHAGYNLQLIGRHDGVNENGLVAGLHFVSNEDYRVGISPWISVRMILDKCSSVDEAILLLKEIPHAACYNFSVADRNGNMAAIEASPKKVEVRWEEDWLSCVNHFQLEELREKNRSIIDGSLKREQYLNTMKNKCFTHNNMYSTFKDKHSPVFFTEYEQLFGTLHTFSYSFIDDRILTTVACGEKDLNVIFGEWVKGANVKEENLIGRITEIEI